MDSRSRRASDFKEIDRKVSFNSKNHKIYYEIMVIKTTLFQQRQKNNWAKFKNCGRDSSINGTGFMIGKALYIGKREGEIINGEIVQLFVHHNKN